MIVLGGYTDTYTIFDRMDWNEAVVTKKRKLLTQKTLIIDERSLDI